MELQTYLSDLEYLVNIDSGSEYPEGINKVAAFFSGKFRELGWIVEEHDLAPESGTCVICKNHDADHFDVMLIGHIDTVFPVGTCAQRPFRVENNVAYGPGAADMKQGCLLMYNLMKDLPKEINDKLNIVVVYNPDEEIGSVYSRKVYAPYAQKSDYCFLYESRSPRDEYCIQRPGSYQFEAEFTGQAGHCGFVFRNDARSAISEMARWIVALDALQSREKETTVNVGVVKGGIKGNVVADKASMIVDIRFRIPEELGVVEATVAELEKQAQEHRIGVRFVKKRMKQAWMLTEKSKAYLEHIEQLGKEQGIPVKWETRGGLSDANIIAEYGPICLDGMGCSGSGGHSEGEFSRMDTLPEVYAFSNMLLKDLADNK